MYVSRRTRWSSRRITSKGTLQQYVGRLHRLHDRKQFVQVYDYVDDYVPMLARMYERRLKGYRAIGYAIDQEVLPPHFPLEAHPQIESGMNQFPTDIPG